ncbi:hypothetical protein BO94DRAFT_583473 [Aspergillus sclerotioniger CBS 115572]|uniref:Uncharacterized protein n=1 Tax=Aspergillus sclerotioniger CBS 115572 TaxID=1450535 RepID=A0A317X4W4_9EURO|nr:hypothetical protein BO94DRAFT_583473 [Aspergillus sclerotioniger CBS 115572]PWY93241.1 hypothetical protein BO94DRAFT_583473 [Aspergillus sclerotioniger CBS 115572]
MSVLVGLGRFLGIDGINSALEVLFQVCDSVPVTWFLGIYRSVEAHVHDAFALKGWEYQPSLGKRTASRLFFRPPILTLPCPLPTLPASCATVDSEGKRLEEDAADNHDPGLTSDGARTTELTGSETPDDEFRSEANSCDGDSFATDTDILRPGEQAGPEEADGSLKGEDLLYTEVESQADTEDGGVLLPVRLLAFAEDKDDNSEHYDCNDYSGRIHETGELDSSPTPCSLGENKCPVQNNIRDETPIGNKEGPVSANCSSELDLPGRENPPTFRIPSPRTTRFASVTTETNTMDSEATKNALKLERLAGGWWDEILAMVTAASDEVEAFEKAAMAATQGMQAILEEATRVTQDLEQVKAAWIHASQNAPDVDSVTAALWNETLAAFEAGSGEAKAALKETASAGNNAVDVHHQSNDTVKPRPKKRRPKTSPKPRTEPEERNPDCIDPEKDFYDVCWDMIKEMGLTGVYVKEKMLREHLHIKHPRNRQEKKKSDEGEKESQYNVCCECHKPIK